jgi:tetratricopeptide (TPR) repeat protein
VSALPITLHVPTPGVDEAEQWRHELVEVAEEAIGRHQYADAVAALAGAKLSPLLHPELALRALFAESWARMYLGEIQEAESLLARAQLVADSKRFTDVDRAEAMYRLGCCRFKRSSVANAIGLLTVALELCDHSSLPCDVLRANILERRSRCYQRQRDWEAARGDIERGLELSESLDDDRTIANVLFQASLVAERTGQLIVSCCYAEEAKALYERCNDRQSVARLLNNLGGITFLLGDVERAKSYLREALLVAEEVGSDPDAAQAISSLAQVHLRTGELEKAEWRARLAIERLDGRVDYLDEFGNAQLVLGGVLTEQGNRAEAERWLQAADETFEKLGSVSHRAAVWMAQGKLAARNGHCEAGAELYRRAAEALQDFHF